MGRKNVFAKTIARHQADKDEDDRIPRKLRHCINVEIAIESILLASRTSQTEVEEQRSSEDKSPSL